MTYGLRYKFDKIPFSYQSSGISCNERNSGIFRKVGLIESGTLPSNAFEVSGIEIIDVHNLTLEEINRVMDEVNGTNGFDASLQPGFLDLSGQANGLFDLRKLENYGNETDFYYWLATPFKYPQDVLRVFSNWVPAPLAKYSAGVRPVITLPSDINLEDTNGDGILEVQNN